LEQGLFLHGRPAERLFVSGGYDPVSGKTQAKACGYSAAKAS
jgi:hypothetical protein